MKLNKALLSLGALVAVVTPIATVVSCGDKTPAKEQPPVTHTGGHPPVVPPITHAGKGGIPTSGEAGTQAHGLDDGILDFRTDKTESDEDLNKVFEQFSNDFDFAGDPHTSMGALNRIDLNKNRTLKKVLIVANPTANNGSVVYYAGLIGYDGSAGDTSTFLYFKFKDFKKPENVKDISPHGSVKEIGLSIAYQSEYDIDFVLIPGIASQDIVNAVKDYAKTQFPKATFK